MTIGKYLRTFQTKEGVIDPLEKRVLPFSYTTSFYALLSAFLYRQSGDQVWQKSCEEALNSELNIIERELALSMLPLSFHWEFKNYSLIRTYAIMRKKLQNDLCKRLRSVLLEWRNTNIDSTNWKAMRAYLYFARYALFKKKSDLLLSRFESAAVLNTQTPEGFFPDTKKSFSLQYHAYTLALLLQYYFKSENEKVKKSFLKGVSFVMNFIDPVGNFNYYGRGQGQIFGYGSLIFVLLGAASITSNPIYVRTAKRVFSYLKRFQDKGIPPLCLNSVGNHLGWYDYNHLGDYLSFLGVYLILSYFVYPNTLNLQKATRISKKLTIFYPNLGLLILRRDNYFVVISSGGQSTSQMGGISRIYPQILPTAGGPPDDELKSYSLNYLGPFYNGNPLLNKTGQLGYFNKIAKLKFDLDDLSVEYIYRFNDGIKINLRLIPKKEITLIPLHLCSFQKPHVSILTKRSGIVPTPDGYAPYYEAETVSISKEKVIEIQLLGELPERNSDEQEVHVKMYKPRGYLSFRSFLFRLISFCLVLGQNVRTTKKQK